MSGLRLGAHKINDMLREVGIIFALGAISSTVGSNVGSAIGSTIGSTVGGTVSGSHDDIMIIFSIYSNRDESCLQDEREGWNI